MSTDKITFQKQAEKIVGMVRDAIATSDHAEVRRILSDASTEVTYMYGICIITRDLLDILIKVSNDLIEAATADVAAQQKAMAKSAVSPFCVILNTTV